MMTISVRAVFENGTLRLLKSIDLVEGQEIEVVIITEQERAIEDAFRGQRPLSETIIEERREGP
jgi:predicted DNA-binding antitoxin AbrB/MazE fold protein